MSSEHRETQPITPLSFYILLALGGGPLHGYAVIKAVEANAAGSPIPGTGTFYSAIRRMTGEGLIVEVDTPPGADSSDSRRRYYAITDVGRAVLQSETRRLEQLVHAARALGATASSRQ